MEQEINVLPNCICICHIFTLLYCEKNGQKALHAEYAEHVLPFNALSTLPV